jgi:NDP-sugar pyrophosphorylase family protein
LGVLRKAALASFGDAFDLAAVYRRLLEQGELAAFEVDGRIYEIGSHDGLAETRALLSRPGQR